MIGFSPHLRLDTRGLDEERYPGGRGWGRGAAQHHRAVGLHFFLATDHAVGSLYFY